MNQTIKHMKNYPTNHNRPADAIDRRSFLKHSSVAAATVASLPFAIIGQAAPDDAIRIAIIGCGGRGKGAGKDALDAAPNVKIVALADVFPEQTEKARQVFTDVPAEHCFSGLDAYQKAIGVPGVNYVILATPPGFRPIHLQAAVQRGKHVFMEKPVATDAPGVRTVLAAGDLAREKGLSVVAGTQRRHASNYIECVQRLRDGAIGNIITLRAYWNGRGIWHRGDVGTTEMERQLRNWYHYIWLSGDHIVEQHVHNLDVCNWIMNDHPVRCWGVGGRQCRTESGEIYDHFSVEYEYASGVRLFSFCRQMPGAGNVGEGVNGSNGDAKPGEWIRPKAGPIWRAPKGQKRGAYVQEHTDLMEAIRNGKSLNETQQVAESTLTAILGREAAYSGRVLEWDDAMKWQTSLVPDKIEWGPAPKPMVPMPGQHRMT